jgi:hypothetical protein
MWCIPSVTPEFITRMEHVLDLYAEPYNAREPVICFDEKSKQLLEDTRTPRAMKPNKLRCRDYEYKRNGTRNIFLAVEPKAGFRSTSVTHHRTKTDFAHEIERIISLPRYAEANCIHIVVDNLNTHFEASLIETFGKRKAKNLMRRVQFHYTPKHGSWLNMAEIELSIMGRQCLNRRIPDEALLTREAVAWEQYRNDRHATIQWRFTVHDARRVFREYYKAKLVE